MIGVVILNTVTNTQLDDLDITILNILTKDPRTSYLEIARLCNVSGSTIHVRMKKIEDLGIIKGSKLLLDTSKLGYDICGFIGISLENSTYMNIVTKELSELNEIIELHLTTGQYPILAKVVCKNIQHLQNLLLNNIQIIKGIQKTDISLSLCKVIDREVLF